MAVLKRGGEGAGPDPVGARLEDRERRVVGEGEDVDGVGEHEVRRHEDEGEAGGDLPEDLGLVRRGQPPPDLLRITVDMHCDENRIRVTRGEMRKKPGQ